MELLFVFSAFLAEIIGTIAGFGSSTILLPVALVFFDFRTALVLVAILHLFGTLSRTEFFRKGIRVNIILQFGIPSIACSLVGAFMVSIVPQELLKGLLGVFLVVFVLISFWKHNLRLQFSKTSALVGGATSGFVAGLIGTGGAIRGAFIEAFQFKKETHLATAAAIGLLADGIRVPAYLMQGFLKQEYYLYVPALLAAGFIGAFIGERIVKHIPQKQFRFIVLAALLLVGIKFAYDWVFFEVVF